MATDQEILDAAQAKLLEKRKGAGVTNSPIQLITSALSDSKEERIHGILKPIYDKFPECEHGQKAMFCEECKRIAEEKQAELVERERLEGIKLQELRERERIDHPEIWLKKYGVPVKYHSASFDNFSGGNGVKERCRQFPDKNIALHGNTGCGKTHLAVSTLREMIQKDTIPDYHDYSGYTQIHGAMFITVPNLLMEIRASFKDNLGETEKEIVGRYVTYPLLILDDLGSDRATEWAIETLYLIIDGRDSNLKPTFITTNLSVQEIESHYGARIASRIAGMQIVNINLPDYRKKREAA
jgi:DNA replication protein DnaC